MKRGGDAARVARAARQVYMKVGHRSVAAGLATRARAVLACSSAARAVLACSSAGRAPRAYLGVPR